jgi:hypothetical protein
MRFDPIDVDKPVQLVAEDHNGARAQRRLQSETGSAHQPGTDTSRVSPEISSPQCAHCHHGHCPDCEECSATKQFSDYWICHCCGELNLRVPNLYLREGSHGLGKN